MEIGPVAAAALICVAVGCVIYVFAYSYISGEKVAEKRLRALAEPFKRSASNVEHVRRSHVASTLKELDIRQKNKNKLTLEKRISYAGVRWSKAKFFLISGAMAVICAVALFAVSFKPILAGAGLVVGGVGLPRWLLGYLCRRRVNRFIEDLPGAMDIIVRGVRVGLPIGDCLRTIVTEMNGPIQVEFRGVMEALTLGVPLKEAIFRLPERIPVPEANFIAIVISLQQTAGGNLSSALANLSTILRDRKKLRGKIAAMSMEAKASATIIGSLPVVVALLVHMTTPRYLEPLWTTTAGTYVLGGSAALMGFGILVMKKMINFKF